ncbi:MAG: helix-turn-helix domain-containing protein [Eubacterium sp.]|nr:helix-turn-helix domain-containing protein [Eubacterium sp.]
MTQKEFSKKTGISQSAISEWKSKNTNPSADKIMIICHVLKVSPEWLLSGIEKKDSKDNEPDFLVIDKKTEMGKFISDYNRLSDDSRLRLLGYMYALSEEYREQINKYKKEFDDLIDKKIE